MWSAASFLRSHFFLLCRPMVLRRFATSPSVAAAGARDSSRSGEESDRFLAWFRAKAGAVVSTKLAVGTSSYGRMLVASQPIQAGECILEIPFSAQIFVDNLITEIKSLLGDNIGEDEIESLLGDDIADDAKLAFLLLIEQKKGQDSEWAMYIHNLPPIEDLHSTIFWDEAELDMILPSTIYWDTINHRANIEKDFFKIKSALEGFSQSFEDFHMENFMHAYALVASRAWGTSKGPSLIPFADILNHDGMSDAGLLSDEDKETSEVIADKDFIIGEEFYYTLVLLPNKLPSYINTCKVFIRYGKFSNATLILDFGFTVFYNIHDQVQICLTIDQHDALCAEKVELLHKHDMPTIMCTENGTKSHGIVFTIKEVKNEKGKGRGIPQSLRAFSRVLAASKPQELEEFAREAAQDDGRLARHQLKNVSKEIAAHCGLLSEMTEIIRKYDASIKSLGIMDFHSVSSKLHIRRNMAKDLLAGELRVLKSASAWLTHYCAKLSASIAVHPE